MVSRLKILAPLLLLGAATPPETAQRLVASARGRLAANDFSGALVLSQRAVALAPRDPAVLLLAGNLVRDRYGPMAALPWYDRVLQIDPENVFALSDKAATLGDSGQSIAMLAVTRRILALTPGQPIALYQQAVLAARAGQWGSSRALLDRTGGAFARVPAVMLLRGAIALQTGATETAIAALNSLVEIQPGNRHARRLLGLALWRSEDDQGALDTLQPIAEDGDSWVLTVMARAAENLGDRVRAANLLDRAANAPAQPVAWQGGGPGDAMMASGQWPAAVVAYTEKANVRFTVPTALRLIDALNRVGQVESAGAVMTTLVLQNPASLPVLRLAASDALGRHEWARAATALAVVRNRVGDHDAFMLGNLGWAYFNLGYSDKAIQYSRKAYELAPANALAAANHGWFVHRGGNRQAGLALLQKAVAIAPDAAPFRRKLAEAQRP